MLALLATVTSTPEHGGGSLFAWAALIMAVSSLVGTVGTLMLMASRRRNQQGSLGLTADEKEALLVSLLKGKINGE